jgi:hypothetical protein
LKSAIEATRSKRGVDLEADKANGALGGYG